MLRAVRRALSFVWVCECKLATATCRRKQGNSENDYTTMEIHVATPLPRCRRLQPPSELSDSSALLRRLRGLELLLDRAGLARLSIVQLCCAESLSRQCVGLRWRRLWVSWSPARFHSSLVIEGTISSFPGRWRGTLASARFLPRAFVLIAWRLGSLCLDQPLFCSL